MSNRQFWVLITVIVLGFIFLSVPDWVAMRKEADEDRRQRQITESYVVDIKGE